MQKFPDWVSSEIYVYLCSLLLLWQSWYSPSEYVQQVQHFCHCLKNCWNCLYGTANCAVSSCSQISGTSGNLVPDTCSFICINKKKSQGARWSKWGWGPQSCFLQPNIAVLTECQCIVMVIQAVTVLLLFWAFSADCSFRHCKKLAVEMLITLLTWKKTNSCWTVTSFKKKDQCALDVHPDFPQFPWAWRGWSFPQSTVALFLDQNNKFWFQLLL